MRAVVVLFIFLVASLCVDDGQTIRFGKRSRRIGFWRKAYRPNRFLLCPHYCPRVCSGGRYCRSLCHRLCKRGIRLQDVESFPSKFQEYDNDKDGHISPGEFTKLISSNIEHSDQIFDLVDQDDDVQLDQEEFDAAPFKKTKDE